MDRRTDDMDQMATITAERTATGVTLEGSIQRPSVELLAQRRLADNCTCAFCFNQVTFSYSAGILTLEGRLPSFYLKQVLQTLLRDLEGVTRIDNRVDVVR